MTSDIYEFTVTATNTTGTSGPSAASAPVVPFSAFGILSVTPSQLPEGSASSSVMINGNGFVSPLSVSVAGGGVTTAVTELTPTAVTVMASVSSGAVPGPRDVTVTDPNGSIVCTGCLSVAAPPTVTSATPNVLALGASGIVTLSGTGFEAGAAVKIAAPTKTIPGSPSSVVGPTTIQSQFRIPLTAPTGAYTIRVANPDGGTATCSGCLTIIPPPTLVEMSPASAAPGSSVPVTLSGSGFATGLRITGPNGVTFSKLSVVDETTVNATMTVQSTATSGTELPVNVINSLTAGHGSVTGDILTII